MTRTGDPVRHVAFVRNVMIGREGLARETLLGIFARHGATEPVSYISTGNVGFTARPGGLARLVGDVEASIAAVIGRHEPLYVRTLDRLAVIAARDPWSVAPIDAYERLVSFTSAPVVRDLDLPIVSDRGDYVILEADDREIYSATILVDGRIRSPGGHVERLVGSRITTRSWGTVQRVLAKELERT